MGGTLEPGQHGNPWGAPDQGAPWHVPEPGQPGGPPAEGYPPTGQPGEPGYPPADTGYPAAGPPTAGYPAAGYPAAGHGMPGQADPGQGFPGQGGYPPGGYGTGGYPSQQFGGPPPPAGPPAPRKGRGLLIGGIAAVLVLALCGGLLAVLFTRGGDGATFEDPAKRQARLAGEDLAKAASALSLDPGATYKGSYTADGDEIEVTARVTNSGWMYATLKIDGAGVVALSNGPRTYLKAPKAYWSSNGAPRDTVDDYAKRWVLVPPDQLGADLSRVLAPGILGADLAAAAERGEAAGGATSKIGDTDVREVLTPQATVYVTTSEPHRVVRIATPKDDSDVSPSGRSRGFLRPAYAPAGSDLPRYQAPEGPEEFEFDVTGLSEQEVTGLFRELEKRLNELKNSIDSQVTFSLRGGITLKPCTVSACVATVTIGNSVSSKSRYLAVKQNVQATVTINFTLDGRPVKVCHVAKAMKPNGSAKVTCRATYSVPADGRTHRILAVARAVATATVSADLKRMFADLKAERDKGAPKPPGKEADLGPKWKPCNPATIEDDKGGCEKVAAKIKSQIGGESHTIRPPSGARSLGKYRGYDTPWANHEVVVKDGRVYDAWTGRHGEPIAVYKSRWEYGDVLNFGF
ncbi:MAG: hypothetical protein ACRDT6_11765 [Micromonosporaceae bacterium]